MNGISITDKCFEYNKFACYNGYPLIFVHKITNEVICLDCAEQLKKETLINDYVFDIHYEGDDIYCESCQNAIESAYGIPEEEL